MTQPGAESTPSDPPAGSEQPPEQTDQQGSGQEPPQQPVPVYDQAYVDQLRRESARYRNEAKAKERELTALQRSALPEQERAVQEAVDKAVAEAVAAERKTFGARLTRTTFQAAAAEKGVPLDAILEDLDLGRFINDDGEPDTKRITATVERFAALAAPKTPERQSFDGGPRQTAAQTDMNSFIRGQLGYQAT